MAKNLNIKVAGKPVPILVYWLVILTFILAYVNIGVPRIVFTVASLAVLGLSAYGLFRYYA